MTDEQITKLCARMDTQFAVWAVRVSRFPRSVWHTARLHNPFHYTHRGALEEHPTMRGLVRPTELGIAAARLYCKRAGLEVE